MTSQCLCDNLLDLMDYNISHIYSRENHLEIVQFVIRNAKLSDDTASYVLRWASG